MPLFPKKSHHRRDLHNSHTGKETSNFPQDDSKRVPFVKETTEENSLEKNKVSFHCQQAQGSPTGIISGFTNVQELYQKISECYDFTPEEIIFCTLNTHKIDMSKLLSTQMGFEDFIFVHRKGRAKEIELTKTETSLGLTITDNGNGLSFIKKIKEGSVVDNIDVIHVGDHIEKINNESCIGKRHFEVAQALKNIPQGDAFTLRLIEPLKAGFSHIGPRGESKQGKKAVYGSGKETIRFKAGGAAVIEMKDELVERAVNKINEVLENFLGISDSEMATQLWEHSVGKKNSIEFQEAVENSDLEELRLFDEFLIDLWGVITDVRDGRV